MRGRVLGVRAALLGAALCSLSVAQAAQPPSRALSQRPAVDSAAQRALAARVRELGRTFPGLVGIAVRNIDERAELMASWNGTRFFPQQSVSKFWVAITAFQRADAGALDLDRRVTITRADLTLFNQPIAAQIGPNGYTTTLGTLIFRALTQSDNTCNDIVLRHAGGPGAVRAMFARNRLEGIRFGPGERLLQAGIAGMQWSNAFSMHGGFETARNQVPVDRRREAFERYIADPVDGVTPEGATNGLARLQRGELLSRASTTRLLQILSQVRTGPQRLRGGLPAGWSIGHKTGSGQILNGVQAGYNDIGILTSPEGRHYAVAVLIGRTSAPNQTRMQLMQHVTRAVVAYDQAQHDEGGRQRGDDDGPKPERRTGGTTY
ncbi:serine hydrolase [Allosphingosinicella sp.]|uniref:serine hydrolase n=1 Tax=Allosphingosinicella sp. TaxID=2823234 RepID=UPI003784F33F